MKKLIVLLLIITLGVWVGLKLKADPGYVLLAYQHWTIEMPLWLAMISLFFIFIILYYLLKIIGFTHHLSLKIHHWTDRYHANRSHQLTTRGLIQLAEGHWARAENYLKQGAKFSETPLINYIPAARAAQQLGAYDRRDQYLRLAYRATPEAEMAVGLTQAELQRQQGQLEVALATLNHLRQIAPKHPYVLKLLVKTHISLHDWESLPPLLKLCRSKHILTVDELEKLERQTFMGLIITACKKNNLPLFENHWKILPKQFSHDPAFVDYYVKILLLNSRKEEALSLIKNTLKKEWNEHLIKIYGSIESDDIQRQLNIAESFFKTHPDDPMLLLTLARLCIKDQLWGKARHYIEKSLTIATLSESYLELGRILENLNEPQKAMMAYRQGLTLIESTDIPQGHHA